jgi:hypothetical protein
LLLGACAARPAHAMTDNQVVKAHVPFAFHVEDKWMPAGNYTLKPMEISEPGLIEIRSVETSGPAAVFLTVPKDRGTSNEPELLFDDVGHQKFLRAIVLPDQTGAELPVVAAEVQAARKLATQARPTHAVS